MAVTTAELEDLRDALIRAIGKRETTATTSDGKSVTYKSIKDMKESLAFIRDELGEGPDTASDGQSVSYLRQCAEGS